MGSQARLVWYISAVADYRAAFLEGQEADRRQNPAALVCNRSHVAAAAIPGYTCVWGGNDCVHGHIMVLVSRCFQERCC